ncbi:hypothetical protein D9M69_125820 [compost metagenome]
MTRTTRRIRSYLSPLALLIALGQSTGLSAAEFEVSDWQGRFDSTLSIGAIWSTQAPDKKLIGVLNGGRGNAIVSDDGRLNFKRGQVVSNIFKGLHELELSNGDSGLFVRGNYWYDFELKDGSRELYDIDDSGRLRAAKTSGAQFLDAFVYHRYSLGDMSGSARLGKQVVSWGESTFIANSINAINPIDVAALRRPGAELKEALIPANMLYLSHAFNEALSLETFYQLGWSETIIDNCGTFFASSDLVARGCDRAPIAGAGDLNPAGQVYLPRLKDHTPSDSGQFGLALKWYAEQLNSSEFGAYFINYHSRTPNLSGVSTDGSLTPGPDGIATGARYFAEYAEDIRLYGLSFQTLIEATGTSLGGEISHRPNMPMQINPSDLVGASMAPGNMANPLYLTGHAGTAPGTEITGYVRKPFTQAQVTATHIFPRVLGASRLLMVGELGYSHIAQLENAGGQHLRFGRDTLFGAGVDALGNCTPQPGRKCTSAGFYTDDSWGYRLRTNLEYPNALFGATLSPSLAFAHDVDGYGPTFNEGSKAISLGLDYSYRNTYSASLNYTDFYGGRFSTQSDRDFLSISFAISF